uniref:Sorting nexin-6 (Trinotate prediction) n=1 Tax=Henneguya salminicola TaxID=69463 RepID=A0A6G3MFC1_HENSL
MEREYLVMFRKTVAFHTNFLNRISKHPLLKIDSNFIEFSTAKEQLNTKISKATHLTEYFKDFKKKINVNIVSQFSKVMDPDRFFFEENRYISNYCLALKNVLTCSDSMIKSQKRPINAMIKLSEHFSFLSNQESSNFSKILVNLADFFDSARKTECEISDYEDYKLCDTLSCDYWSTLEIRELLLRRIKIYATSENSFKILTKAKQTNKNVAVAEDQYQQDEKKFQDISESAKTELTLYAYQRSDLLKKNLTMYCEVEIQNFKRLINQIQSIIEIIQADD